MGIMPPIGGMAIGGMAIGGMAMGGMAIGGDALISGCSGAPPRSLRGTKRSRARVKRRVWCPCQERAERMKKCRRGAGSWL